MFHNLSISVPKELLNFGTTMLENSDSTTNESLPHLTKLNEAIQVLDTSLSNIGVLHLGGVEGAGLATILGIVASSGLMIRGIFVYYLANYAPKNRPINKLMMLDQVRNILSLHCNHNFKIGYDKLICTSFKGHSAST